MVKIAGLLPLKVDPEKSMLFECFGAISELCDEVIVLHDNPTDGICPVLPFAPTETIEVTRSGDWNDFLSRMMLLVAATRYGCRWGMQMDDDELQGPSLTYDRIHELCALADQGGFGEVQVRVRTMWNDTHWRTDGIFGEMRKTFLLVNPMFFNPVEFMYGPGHQLHHFPTLRKPAMLVDDFIVHWGLRTRHLREKNVSKYQKADPENKWSCYKYDYLLSTEGIRLEKLYP